MTESLSEKKHGLSKLAKQGGDCPSPPPQRGSTQPTVISGSSALVRDEPVSNAPGPHSSGKARDGCDCKATSLDWANYQSDSDSDCPKERSTQRKRPRIESGPPSPEGSFIDGAWPQIVSRVGDSGVQPLTPKLCPRFLVVESDTPDHPLSRCNIFAVNTWFKGVSTQLVGRVSKAGTGFLVDCPSERVARLLLGRNGSKFISLTVRVSAHRSLNSSKGVIWCPDLEGIEEEEILANLRSEGVSRVERCFKKKGGIKVPTHTLFLTFDNPSLPEYIVISCFLKVKVSLFVPRPLQCYTCFRFGHPSSKCKKKEDPVCGRCGHGVHEGACTEAAVCPNCKGSHAPNSKQCPVYKKEALIKKLMVVNKISFKEARIEAERQIEGSVPQKGKSFANAATTATGMQSSNNNPSSNLKRTTQKMSQLGEGLPEAIRAEALALAKDLRESLKPKVVNRNSSNAKSNNPKSQGPKNKNRGPVNKNQAKPGNSTAPTPQAAVPKQAKKPANQPVPKTGPKPPTAATPKAAATKQASRPDKLPAPHAGPKDSASAPQAAGSTNQSPAKQATKPVPSSSKARPRETPEPAPQAAGMEQAVETALPSSDNESEMEVTPASAPQAAEAEQISQPVAGKNNQRDSPGSPALSPKSPKEGLSFANAAQKGAMVKPASKEPQKPKGTYNFEIQLAKQTAKKRTWSKKSKSKGESTFLSENRYSPLTWSGFEDPEALDPNASFPDNY